jgi:hypothetical protein
LLAKLSITPLAENVLFLLNAYTPDLTHDSVLLYGIGLSVLEHHDIHRFQRFQELPYGKKIELLVRLRFLSKDRSLPEDYELYKSSEDMDGILENLLKEEVNK